MPRFESPPGHICPECGLNRSILLKMWPDSAWGRSISTPNIASWDLGSKYFVCAGGVGGAPGGVLLAGRPLVGQGALLLCATVLVRHLIAYAAMSLAAPAQRSALIEVTCWWVPVSPMIPQGLAASAYALGCQGVIAVHRGNIRPCVCGGNHWGTVGAMGVCRGGIQVGSPIFTPSLKPTPRLWGRTGARLCPCPPVPCPPVPLPAWARAPMCSGVTGLRCCRPAACGRCCTGPALLGTGQPCIAHVYPPPIVPPPTPPPLAACPLNTLCPSTYHSHPHA